MITEMRKFTFLVFHRDYDLFLQTIRDLGVVHITEKGSGHADNEQLQTALQHADQLRKLIAQGAPDQLLHERQQVEQRIQDVQREADQMAVWGDFSPERIQQLQQAGYQLRFFTCARALFNKEWGIEVAERGQQVYFVQVLGPQDEAIDLTEHAHAVTLSEKSSSQLLQDVDNLRGLLAAAQARIDAWQLDNMPRLEQELRQAKLDIDWHRVCLNTDDLAEGSLKLLEGFCPAEQADALKQVLDSQDVYYEESIPEEEDKTPIKLRNNRFTKLFESLTGMYGWPVYGEWDPTPVLAPFYLLFFAMCLGDAGYGLVLLLFGLLTAKGKVNVSMFEGLGPIIAVLGAGTMVVGLVLGTCFGVSLYDAAWYPEALKHIIIHGQIMGFDSQMLLAMGIGVFHIIIAMTVKALCYTQRYGFRQTVSTWGWLLLIVGGILTACATMVGWLSADATRIVLIAIGAVSALGIYLFNTPGRNPIINIFSGLYDTYNMASGLMSDVLSYVRLYALGLAGGMLGGTFNDMGLMIVGSGEGSVAVLALKWVGAVLVIIAGHVLNVLLSSLGAFVHPLRLTFVEYFKNSGYEGRGQKYTPFAK